MERIGLFSSHDTKMLQRKRRVDMRWWKEKEKDKEIILLTKEEKFDFISHSGLISLNLLFNIFIPLLGIGVFTTTTAAHL